MTKLSRIDLNLLVSLDVLLTERNVTHAARRLSLSQPALSAQLKQLRAMLGDPLLLPAARGMTPTARALELQGPLRATLATLGSLVAEGQPFDPASARDTFHIAATDSVQAAVCVPLVARLRARAPGVRVALLPADGGRLGEQLASGELDLALAGWACGDGGAVRGRRIFDGDGLASARPRRPRAALAARAGCRGRARRLGLTPWRMRDRLRMHLVQVTPCAPHALFRSTMTPPRKKRRPP